MFPGFVKLNYSGAFASRRRRLIRLPGHAWKVPPEVAGAVRSRDLLSINHDWVRLEGEQQGYFLFHPTTERGGALNHL